MNLEPIKDLVRQSEIKGWENFSLPTFELHAGICPDCGKSFSARRAASFTAHIALCDPTVDKILDRATPTDEMLRDKTWGETHGQFFHRLAGRATPRYDMDGVTK